MVESRRNPSHPAWPSRRRRSTRLVSLGGAILFALLAGCSKAPPPSARLDTVRPALILAVGSHATMDGGLRLPGRIRAAKRAELSFDVPGFLDRFSLDEGRRIKAGEIVARLDDSVYRARLSAARAEFERARTDLARYQRLWETELAVARSEVDERNARLEAARTSLAAAEKDLADTVIRAPFDGVITRRRIEPFTNVQAKQPIADLQDLRALEVVVNVPERLVRRMQPHEGAIAFLEGGAPEPLKLVLKSYGAEADPLTQTYPVVLTITTLPKGLTLLPGMAVTVAPTVDPEREPGSAPPTTVPLTAIAADAQGQPGVWIVREDGSVTRRTIRTGAIMGAEITVASGLEKGERIVAAGIGELREGLRVRPLDAR